jgi:hypothetical protein
VLATSPLPVLETAFLCAGSIAHVRVGRSDVDAHNCRGDLAVFFTHQREMEHVGADLRAQVLQLVARSAEAVEPLDILLRRRRRLPTVHHLHLLPRLRNISLRWREVVQLHLQVHLHLIGDDALLIGSAVRLLSFLLHDDVLWPHHCDELFRHRLPFLEHHVICQPLFCPISQRRELTSAIEVHLSQSHVSFGNLTPAAPLNLEAASAFRSSTAAGVLPKRARLLSGSRLRHTPSSRRWNCQQFHHGIKSLPLSQIYHYRSTDTSRNAFLLARKT